MAYNLSWEAHGFIMTFEGVFTDADLLNCNLPIYDDPRALTFNYQIADFSRVTQNTLSLSAVRRIAALDVQLSKKNPDVKVATITTSSLMYDLAHLYESVYDDLQWETAIFENIEDARRWINS